MATAPIRLAQGSEEGLLVVLPVFGKGTVTDVAGRRERIEGYAVAVFRVHLPRTGRPDPAPEAAVDVSDHAGGAPASGPPAIPDIPIAELEDAPLRRGSDA